MEMTLRWYGSKFDSVTLEQIRQIPGVTGVITTLYDIPAGEVWPMEKILQMKKEVEDSGLKIAGIERNMIVRALEKAGGNKTKAAKLLNLSRSRLYDKLDKYNLKY